MPPVVVLFKVFVIFAWTTEVLLFFFFLFLHSSTLTGPPVFSFFPFYFIFFAAAKLDLVILPPKTFKWLTTYLQVG